MSRSGPTSIDPRDENQIMKKNKLTISTDDGDLTIDDDELPTITDEEFKEFRISRQDLWRCFQEGIDLMVGRDPAEMRPIADRMLDGTWIVNLVRYSQHARRKSKSGSRPRLRLRLRPRPETEIGKPH